MIDKKNTLYVFTRNILLATIFFFIIAVGTFTYYKLDYKLYFSNNSYQYDTSIDVPITGSFVTTIDHDNTYVNANIKNENDAINLILDDSNLQKKKCTNKEINAIEKQIEDKYGIVAVNLCELDYDFALEIENVLAIIYQEFPNVSGYMTNLTLMNVNKPNAPLASFNYGFIFSTSNNMRGYPWVIKNQILLNSNYFLDSLTLNSALRNASNIGYFPKNTTRYSLVAHEFGHYLSFVASNRYYQSTEKFLIKKMNYSTYHTTISNYAEGTLAKKIISEAYKNYNNKNPNTYFTEDSFRESISQYAVAINSQGQYIYDETIAEAFHDYFVNGRNASLASQEIIKVLKKYL